MSNPNLPATRVVTGEVRLSFVHLFVPYVNPKNDDPTPKYSTTILIPKSDTATMQRLQAAINAAVTEGVKKGVWSQNPAQPKTPVWDGDGARSSGEAFGPECKGHWVITVSSKQQPQIVDVQGNPIINQSEVYSGMYARVSINFFAYNNKSKGIGAGLGNVMKLRDGESLAGGRSASDDFGVSPAAAQYAPPQTYRQTAPASPVYAPAPGAGTAVDPITGQPV